MNGISGVKKTYIILSTNGLRSKAWYFTFRTVVTSIHFTGLVHEILIYKVLKVRRFLRFYDGYIFCGLKV
jgi:hypothetical protein